MSNLAVEWVDSDPGVQRGVKMRLTPLTPIIASETAVTTEAGEGGCPCVAGIIAQIIDQRGEPRPNQRGLRIKRYWTTQIIEVILNNNTEMC